MESQLNELPFNFSYDEKNNHLNRPQDKISAISYSSGFKILWNSSV